MTIDATDPIPPGHFEGGKHLSEVGGEDLRTILNAVKTQLTSGGSALANGPPVAKTANYTVVGADDGSTFSNVGAVGVIALNIDSGLADGFEFRAIQFVGQTLTLTPPAGELLSLGSLGAGLAGQAVDLNGGTLQVITLKKVQSTWVLVAGRVESGQFEAFQLETSDLSALNGIQNANQIATQPGQTSAAFTFRLVQEAGPNNVIGAQDEADTYVDGVDLGALEGVYLEIQNEDGMNGFAWGPNVSVNGTLDLTFPTVGDANVGSTSLNITVSAQIPSIPASQTDTYWVNTVGSLYLRNQGAGAVIDFATAVAAGAL